LDKTLQRSNWDAAELSEEQLSYAARDSKVLVPLREAMIPKLAELGLFRVAQLEFEAVPAIAAVELAGLFLQRDLWQQQIDHVSKEHEIIARELQEMLAAGAMQTTLFGHTDINLNSHPQIADALKQMGVPIDSATNNTVLLPLKDQFPVVAKLLEYRALDKSLTSYGAAWLDLLNPETLRLYPDFNQIGAPTGRMSCADPNVQQVPTEKQYRQCFRAPAGRKLLICDYSQIELRILAELSMDKGFVDAFRSGADLHRTTAASVFNVAIDSVSKEQRDFAKRLNFGVVYGIGAQRFAFMTGMKLHVAEETLKRYFQTYRKLDEYLRHSSQQAVDNRSTRTLSGRLVQYRFDPADREQVSNVRRRGRNAPIQGTSADILKRALALLHHDLKGTSAQIVNIIHDEIVVEVDEHDAEELSHRVSAKMVQAATEYITAVPVLAEPTISDEWVK
jgi:DNA polymerase I-like protein with 3'-5' exonuclease and polymerase domains